MSKQDVTIVLASMLALAVVLGLLSIVPLTFMWAWNAFIVTVTGLAPHTYFQAVAGLVLLVTAVFLVRDLRK